MTAETDDEDNPRLGFLKRVAVATGGVPLPHGLVGVLRLERSRAPPMRQPKRGRQSPMSRVAPRSARRRPLSRTRTVAAEASTDCIDDQPPAISERWDGHGTASSRISATG